MPASASTEPKRLVRPSTRMAGAGEGVMRKMLALIVEWSQQYFWINC
jgi:hypothetical protein